MGFVKLIASVLTPFLNFLRDATTSNGPGPHYRGFMITLRHTTLGRTPLDK
jgi:hypothetical protein